jgi:hypothetical protein
MSPSRSQGRSQTKGTDSIWATKGGETIADKWLHDDLKLFSQGEWLIKTRAILRGAMHYFAAPPTCRLGSRQPSPKFG